MEPIKQVWSMIKAHKILALSLALVVLLALVGITQFQPAAETPQAIGSNSESSNSETDNPTSAPAEGTAALADLTGDIVIDGSSTVFPVTQAAVEEFSQQAPEIRISVSISGSGGGFKRFCNGETDISNASRPIRPEEVELCADNGIEFVEIPIALDGLSVIVNPENDFASCLTVEELKTIWSPEAQGTITTWDQVRDTFPAEPLTLFGAGTDSGTFDYFTEAIVGQAKSSRSDYQATEDDNITTLGVTNDPYALGYLGYAYVVVNQDKVQPVAIDNGDGCVTPSFETIRDASYQPLARPLFLYVNADAASEPALAAFMDYYLSPAFTPLIETPEVGYVSLDEEIYEAGRARLEDRVTGSLFLTGEEVGATLDRYLVDR